MSGSSKFAIRLSVEGAQQAGAALKGVPESAAHGVKTLGDASDRTGQKMRGLRADTSAATPAMRTLDNAAKGVGDAFTGIANRIPVIGPGLAAIGPAGLAAAAGIAAIGGAFFAMNGMAQKSREYLDDIATQAANMSTSAETYQTLTALAIEQDIEFNKLAEAMNKLQLGAAMAAKGQGELYSTLKRVKPELVDVLVQAETQEDRWDALSRAISGTENQLDKVAIAKAAFGEKGAQFIRMLEGEDKTIGNLTTKYKEMGLVLEERLIIAVAEADTRMDLAHQRMEVQGVRAGTAMIGIVEKLSGVWSDLNVEVGIFFDRALDIEDRSYETLDRQYEELDQRRKRLAADLAAIDPDRIYAGKRGRAIDGEESGAVRAQRLQAEIKQADRSLAELAIELAARAQVVKGAVSDDTVVTDPVKDAEAARLAAEAARLRAAAEKEVSQILAERGDITMLLAEREKRLGELVAANVGLTREMADDVLRKYRESLDGTAEAQGRVNAILASARTPLQNAQAEFSQLTIDVLAGKVAYEDYAKAAEILEAKIGTLAQKTVEVQDAFGRTTETIQKTQEASFELRFAAETLGGIFDQNIETLEDLGQVAMRVFRQMAIEAMLAQSKIAGSSFLQIIGAAFGFGGGGPGASGYVDPADVAYATPGTQLSAYGQYHTGGFVGGAPPQLRVASGDIFASAPRNHRGYPLAADERAVIAQVGEPIVAKWDARRIMEAVERGSGSGGVKINIINQSGGEVETRERRGAGGEREIEVLIKRVAGAGIASGDFDNAMASRYGQRPRVR